MLTDDLAILPMEEGVVDPDFKEDVCTYVQVYAGDEVVPSEHFTVTSSSNYVSINGNKVTLVKNRITPEVKAIPLNIKVGDKETQYPAT